MDEQLRIDWASYTRGDIQESMLNGNHFTIIRPSQMQIVAQKLDGVIKEEIVHYPASIIEEEM